MAEFRRDDLVIRYLERGEGYPILLFAPGGMRSAASYWKATPYNPVTELSDEFRVIAMDQRNAGRSSAPVRDGDGWHVYTADHLALLDDLGIERCHLIGNCIGGSFCLGLIQAAPERVASAVLQQPIGFDDNRQAFYEMFDGWAAELRKTQPDVPDATWEAFRGRMYDTDFVFNVERDFVRTCPTPLLVLMGNDLYHPQSTSRDIVELSPNAELVETWKDEEIVPETVQRVRTFLRSHTP